jgi:hypothetical protein
MNQHSRGSCEGLETVSYGHTQNVYVVENERHAGARAPLRVHL